MISDAGTVAILAAMGAETRVKEAIRVAARLKAPGRLRVASKQMVEHDNRNAVD